MEQADAKRRHRSSQPPTCRRPSCVSRCVCLNFKEYRWWRGRLKKGMRGLSLVRNRLVTVRSITLYLILGDGQQILYIVIGTWEPEEIEKAPTPNVGSSLCGIVLSVVQSCKTRHFLLICNRVYYNSSLDQHQGIKCVTIALQ